MVNSLSTSSKYIDLYDQLIIHNIFKNVKYYTFKFGTNGAVGTAFALLPRKRIFLFFKICFYVFVF